MPQRPKVPERVPPIGTEVGYCPMITDKKWKTKHTVTSHPRLLGEHTWVLSLEGRAGCFSIEALRELEGEPWEAFVPRGIHAIVIKLLVDAASPKEAIEKTRKDWSTAAYPGSIPIVEITDPAGRKHTVEGFTRTTQRPHPQCGEVTADDIAASPGLRLDAGYYLRRKK